MDEMPRFDSEGVHRNTVYYRQRKRYPMKVPVYAVERN